MNAVAQNICQDIQPVAEPGTGRVAKGDAVSRIDGPAKVTGMARYAAEHSAPDMGFGVVVNSTIAKGRITELQLDETRAMPGVLDILSHLHRPKVRKLDLFYKNMTAPGGSPFKPFHSDGVLYSGVEHHNPMEMHASTVIRADDGHLTIYDKTQSSQNSRWMVSQVFGLGENKVTVKNPFVGGAFGSGLRPQYQLILAVMGALQLKRSVQVVLTRQQMFIIGHRPETWHRLKLAADGDGLLRAVVHEAIAETSRIEDYVEVVVNWSGQLYKCDNVRLDYKLVCLTSTVPLTCAPPEGPTACMRWKWRWTSCRMP